MAIPIVTSITQAVEGAKTISKACEMNEAISEAWNLTEGLWPEFEKQEVAQSMSPTEIGREAWKKAGVEEIVSDSDLPNKNDTRNEISKDKTDIEKQDETISNVESGKTPLDTTQQKGNYGEMKTDQDLRECGYERISTDMVTDINAPSHQGIDGVYYNPDGNPPYIIVDSKYGTSQLSETADGKQMSQKWIDNRLAASVGEEMADTISDAMLDGDVGTYVAHIDPDGNVRYDQLDENGNVIQEGVEL